MDNREVIYAKWLSGEISDEALIAAEGPDALADLQRLVKTTDQWTTPNFDSESAYATFKQKHQKKETAVKKMNWLMPVGIAASLLILVIVGINFFSGKDPAQVLFAAHGENVKTTLEDGSEIRLNDGSTLSYHVENWSEERSINLTGEAFFKVEKGSPFTVHTKNGSVRVLGTQFNVRAWGSNLYVECYEGKVEVIIDYQKTILTAKEAVNVVEGSMNQNKAIIQTAPSWQNAMSRFYNEKLDEVFEELERQYNVKVQAVSTERSFSGNFRHDDLETALRNICKPLSLNYTISEDQKTVVIE